MSAMSAVNTMAGSSSIVKAIWTLTKSWSSSFNFQELELSLLGLLVPELRVHDVADLGEVARAAGALVVHRLALGEELEALDRALDLDARPLRDLAHVIPHGGARRRALGVRDGGNQDAHVAGG